MSSAFLQLLNISITAGWIVLAVLILRLCLKKAPRWITCLLWGLVALRLILPFNIESPFSLIPSAKTVVQTESETPPLIEIDSGFAQIDKPLNHWLSSSAENTPNDRPSVPPSDTDAPTDTDGKDDGVSPPVTDGEDSAPQAQTTAVSIETVLHIAAIVWLVGVGVMLLYEIASAVMVRRRVLDAVLRRDTVWESDRVETPFIFGLFRPRIYVPYGLDEQSLELIAAHERAHLHRLDHWLKPFAFTLLAVYWYNPLLWIAYFLLCRDIEVACDERVVKNLSAEDRRLYAAALLKCGSERRTLIGCPLAFGELSIRQRIFSIIGYRKPLIWVVIVSLLVCVLAALCLLTVPQSAVAQGVIDDVISNTTTATTTTTATVPSTTVSATTTVTTQPSTKPSIVVKPTDANHAHAYGDWSIVKAPTCDTNGRRERVCSCGNVQEQAIDAFGHTYIKNVCVTCGVSNGTGFIPDYRFGMANTVGNENGGYCIARQDQWLYFSSNRHSIAKCRVDGTGWTNVYSVREGYVRNINVVGDWIYFFVNIEIGDDPYIAKVRTDGSEFSYVIKSVNVSEMLVVKDTLYFTTIRNPYFDYNNDCSPLYSMSLNGGMTKQIHDGFVSRLCSNGSSLFFEHTPESGKESVRRIDLSTMKRSTMIASYVGRQLLLKDNYLYFQETDETTGEYVIRSYFTGVGLEPTTLGTMHGVAWFAVIRNCVYYYGGIPNGDEWWNSEVGVVEYYPRGDEYEVIYPCNDNIECIALGDCLIWNDYYSPIRIYDYDSSKWIEIHAP